MNKPFKAPKGIPLQDVQIPVELTGEDKERILDDIVSLMEDVEVKQREIAEFDAKTKDERSVYKKQLESIQAKIDDQFTVSKNGCQIKDVTCYIRKNFNLEIPSKEYINPIDGEVLHKVPLGTRDYQTNFDDWVVGSAPEPEPFEEDNDEVESEE